MRRSPSSLAVAAACAACGAPQAAPGSSCPGDRSVVIAGQDDVAQLAACRFAGGLTIRTGAPLDLAPLRYLATIRGDLSIGPTVGLTEASFGELHTVGGAIAIASNGDLHGLFFPKLERAGRIAVESNAALATLSLPRLAAVAGAVVVTGNPDLELIEASALVSIGGELAVAGNARLVLVEAAALATAGSVRIDGNQLLPEDVAGALRGKARPRD